MLKKSLCAVAVAVAAAGLADGQDAPKTEAKKDAAAETPAATATEMNAEQRAAYAIGRNIGSNIKRQGLGSLDADLLARGIREALKGEKSALSDEELQAAIGELQNIMERKKAEAGKSNLEAGRKYLEANGKKEGVKTTKSGLQYLVLRAGNGQTPKATDTVQTHYRGRLIDGSVFDQSYEGENPAATDKPAEFPVNGVISGWTEALQLMKVGDKWRLFIPSELAYKERGAGGDIGPNSTLVFEIELIGIQK